MAIFAGVVLSASAIAQPLTAAPTSIQAIDDGLRRQVERERAQQRTQATLADALRAPVSSIDFPDLPIESPCFDIAEVVFVGRDVAHLRWLDSTTAPLLNRCIGPKGLVLVTEYLNDVLVSQGLVTSRVLLPAQSLEGGRLMLQLHVGRLARVHMVDADRGAKPDDERWGTWRNAFPTAEGRVLDTRDLEQGIEQMNRLPSQNVTTALAPGAAPDTSDLTIERHAGTLRSRLRGGLTLDNSGGPALGRLQASANLAFDDALGVNDIASLAFNGNAENVRSDHRSQSLTFDYSVPWGYSTFSVDASDSRFAQWVQLTTTRTLSSGASNTRRFKWALTAMRSASSRAGLWASVIGRRANSALDGVDLPSQQRRTTCLETGVDIRRLLTGGSSLDASLSYRRAAQWFHAQSDLPSEPGDENAVPTLRPRLWNFEVDLAIPFARTGRKDGPASDWQFTSAFKGQRTKDRTTSVDQIAIGGRWSVRGFDGDAVLQAESGWTWRNEVSATLSGGAIPVSFYAGLDYGRVWGPGAANLLGTHLGGGALGTRGTAGGVQFDVALAVPLAKPVGFRTAPVVLYASGTYGF